MALNVGEQIGDYEVIELLGAGGMGSVYRVRNKITHREEAMKVLLPDLRLAPDLADRFAREIRIHASLDHPNIAALRTALDIDNQLLMVMELVEGITLELRLRQSPIDLFQGVGWMGETLTALAYAHRRGIMHCDVKPGNIIITTANRAKLMDFGIARSLSDPRLTYTGVTMGSKHYIAPELIQGGVPDPRSDIYSVGATLYEVVTGQKPFEGKTDYFIMRAHIEYQPPSPETINRNVPSGLATAIMRALAKAPEDRFQTADEFLLALKRGVSPTVPLNVELAAPPPAAVPAVNWDPATLDRVTRELSKYVGPLARVLVNRAAKTCSNLTQLYDALAAEIPSMEDRDDFIESQPLR